MSFGKIPSSCITCGVLFSDRHRLGRPRRHCSDKCRWRSSSATKNRKISERRRSLIYTCHWCLVSFSGGEKRKFCSPNCLKSSTSHQKLHGVVNSTPLRWSSCADCGAVFVSQFGKRRCVACYLPEQDRLRLKSALRKGAVALGEHVRIEDLMMRDGPTCGLCGDDIDLTLDYPDLMSKSVDHVLPLSLGGTHSMENVQLAHLRCNMSKGARVAA